MLKETVESAEVEAAAMRDQLLDADVRALCTQYVTLSFGPDVHDPRTYVNQIGAVHTAASDLLARRVLGA